LKKNDKVSYVREDAAFHTILAQANSNSRIRKVLEQMHSQMLILRYRTFELSSRTSVMDHRSILNALEKGRQEVAVKLMRDHIRTVRKKLLAHLTRTDGSAVTAASPGRSADSLQ
jgi:DNA-binding GntR family transcriptional regulator